MKLARFQLSEISEQIDPFAIKNFIISDSSKTQMTVSPDYPFVLDGVAFVICVGGSGRVRVNFRDYDISKNSIITILPQFVVEVLERTDDLMMEFLIFSVDFLTEMPSNPKFDLGKTFLQSSCIDVSEAEIEMLLEFHAFVVKQYRRTDHPFREQQAKSLLYALLTEVASIYYNKFIKTGEEKEFSPASHQEELVSQFFKLLLENHKQEKALEFYAGKMFLTPKYLSTVVKERTGRTAFTWINEALIASIKYTLKTTNMTILQISEEFNFPNPSFFGRFFKKHTGMTPVQYRES